MKKTEGEKVKRRIKYFNSNTKTKTLQLETIQISLNIRYYNKLKAQIKFVSSFFADCFNNSNSDNCCGCQEASCQRPGPFGIFTLILFILLNLFLRRVKYLRRQLLHFLFCVFGLFIILWKNLWIGCVYFCTALILTESKFNILKRLFIFSQLISCKCSFMQGFRVFWIYDNCFW